MHIAISTYFPGNSVLHSADARVKIAALALCTVVLFLVKTLPGMLVCAAIVAVATVLSKVPFSRFLPFWAPAIIFALCPLLFNGISFDVYTHGEMMREYYDVASFPALDSIVLWGTFGLDLIGLLYGVVLGVRIFLLIQLSVLFTLTTTAEDVVSAMSWYLKPLVNFGVPVRDAVMVFSIALRFIPLIAQELQEVANAHRVRGSQLDSGPITQRVRAWGNVFIPLFVRLFRRAETMGTAMDARCYGMKTGKNKRR